jgi:hypothetical protein
MNIYDSKYMSIDIDQENHLLYHYWKADSKYLEEEQYKEELLHLVTITAKYRPAKYLLNSKLFSFSITPEMQEWTNHYIISVNAAAGIQYAAMVVPEDFFAFVSITQTMDDANVKDLNNRFFTDEKEAISWLSSL